MILKKGIRPSFSLFAVFSFLSFALDVNAAGTTADNSKENAKIENTQQLTSQDQGNSEADIQVTQKMRQDVVKNDHFSMEAKNIKIITIGGKVTLKGPVKTLEEKNQILDIATRVAGKKNVMNEITIIK